MKVDPDQEFYACGTPEAPEVVGADSLTAAAEAGRPVRLNHCRVAGKLSLAGLRIKEPLRLTACSLSDVDLSEAEAEAKVTLDRCRFQGNFTSFNATYRDGVSFRRSHFHALASFYDSRFLGDSFFGSATFHSQLELDNCHFSGPTDFRSAVFRSTAVISARFSREALFAQTKFLGAAFFDESRFREGASFADAEFASTVSIAGARCDGPFSFPASHWGTSAWWSRLSRRLRRRPQPQLEVVNAEVGNCTSALFRRWVLDENYLSDFKSHHPMLYRAWLASCDCGRSFTLWALWASLLVLGFGSYYAGYPPFPWLPNEIRLALVELGPSLDGDLHGGLTPYYLSVVVFSTLGFGEITPNNEITQLAVVAEVLAGYLTLGILTSILADKVARRA